MSLPIRSSYRPAMGVLEISSIAGPVGCSWAQVLRMAGSSDHAAAEGRHEPGGKEAQKSSERFHGDLEVEAHEPRARETRKRLRGLSWSTSDRPWLRSSRSPGTRSEERRV